MNRMREFMQHDVGILGIISPAIAIKKRAVSRRGLFDKDRNVGARFSMRIDRNRIRDQSPRAVVAERLQIALRSIDVEVRVHFFEHRRAATELERLRRIGVRGERRLRVDDARVWSGEWRRAIEIGDVDDAISRFRNSAWRIIQIAQRWIVELRDRIDVEHARFHRPVQHVVANHASCFDIRVNRMRMQRLFFDDLALRQSRLAIDVHVNAVVARVGRRRPAGARGRGRPRPIFTQSRHAFVQHTCDAVARHLHPLAADDIAAVDDLLIVRVRRGERFACVIDTRRVQSDRHRRRCEDHHH